jgi:hypothetical protein
MISTPALQGICAQLSDNMCQQAHHDHVDKKKSDFLIEAAGLIV